MLAGHPHRITLLTATERGHGESGMIEHRALQWIGLPGEPRTYNRPGALWKRNHGRLVGECAVKVANSLQSCQFVT